MSSRDIEALLATSDSDDSGSGTGGVDLEALLEDDSGDELPVSKGVGLERLLDEEFSDEESDEDLPINLVKLGTAAKEKSILALPSALDTQNKQRIENKYDETSVKTKQESIQSSTQSVENDISPRVGGVRNALNLVVNSTTVNNGNGVGEGYFGSLEIAGRREQRYFQAGTKEIMNALESKRGKRKTAAGIPTTITSTVDSDSGGSFALLDASSSSVKSATMEMLSSQLKRNASYKQHGPGEATALHVNPKYFVIGTTNGLILVFDFFQEIRQVIGSTSEHGTRCTKAVTAIDMSPSGNYLACGYVTGELALWDVTKGTILKRVVDLHRHRISKLTFIWNVGDVLATLGNATEFWTISADASGCANRGHWSKAMWSNYGADFDCLIDGSAGGIPALHALPPTSDWNVERTGRRSSSQNKDASQQKGVISSGSGITVDSYIADIFVAVPAGLKSFPVSWL